MTVAWEFAYEGQENFGGKVKEYLSESLKLAWKGITKIKVAMEGVTKMSIIDARAKEIAEMEINATGGNEETGAIAQQQAEKEYSGLINTMEQINKITGEESVNIEGVKGKIKEVTVDQYVALIQKMNHVLSQLK